MFTGIITDVGTVRAVTPPSGHNSDTRIEILTAYELGDVAIGASIACSGVCLTVTAKGAAEDGAAGHGPGGDGRGWFAADVSGETLSVTSLRAWRAGHKVNLERSLKVGDELGGHIVQGHVDGIGRVVSLEPEGGSTRVWIEAPQDLAPFIAPKGSIAVDGVSLTVNTVDGSGFGLNIIPHTWEHTAFHTLAPDDAVNLEIDVLARYVARLREVS